MAKLALLDIVKEGTASGGDAAGRRRPAAEVARSSVQCRPSIRPAGEARRSGRSPLSGSGRSPLAARRS
ncbi:hypothetical protein BZL30_3770 [Mycobacterium kansasii]|uniref:Uncharacterized protein n=1 Tax=Mycobacterium kansasii TaxID=1768 RepID=A0A1V3XBC3_MYCKA|nr:hypothetical protein BZL30_3770 [Mycobacterium kansasii]